MNLKPFFISDFMQNQVKFVFIETWGCAANQNNTEIIKGALREAALDFTDNPELADIIILNTCVVKGPTEDSIKARVLELEKLKKPIIVAGCMPQVREKWLDRENIYLLGINHIKDICKLIKKILDNSYEKRDFLGTKRELKLNTSKINSKKLVGITQISEGCLGQCSFCLTKLVKGNLYSYPQEKIIENISSDIRRGCREIWLTGQDLASYGLDNDNPKAFLALLKKVLSINYDFKLRLGMMNPNHVLPILNDLLEVYKHENVYKFLHIPVQSGSNKILKLMNRKYTREEFIKIISKFKQNFPHGILATDIIVAYPDESEEDFNETISLMNEIRPDVVNFSKYWPMEGTRAERMEQIPAEIAKKRVSEVQKLHLQIALENSKKYEGKIINVFVNEQDGTNCLARDENYRLVVIKSKEKLLGKTLKVKVKQAFSHYLLAELIN